MSEAVDTKKANKMIAKFMGLQEGWWVPGETKQKQFWSPTGDGRCYYPNELRYHKHAGWLMPVLEKIAKSDKVIRLHTGYESETGKFYCSITRKEGNYSHVIDSQALEIRDSIYHTVVKFITWYNSTAN